jgi:hypothetical protein
MTRAAPRGFTAALILHPDTINSDVAKAAQWRLM